MTPKPLYKIQDLKVGFNGRGELFHIPRLDILSIDPVAVLGPNGSGKTTFLKALSGLLDVPTGTILYKDIFIRSYGKRYSQEVTYVHQHPYLFRGSVYWNLLVGLHPKALTPEEKSYRIHHTLDCLGLSGYGERNIEGLSGGEAYRVALARALVREPKVLLLDEPTAQADSEAKKIILEVLRQVACKGSTTLIFATHDKTLGEHLNARILRLEEFAPCRY